MAEDKKIEIGRNLAMDRSPFSLERHGIRKDPGKDYRWVDPARIDERKYNDGYELVTGGKSSDGTFRTKGNMVLMARSQDKADESAKIKREKTRAQLSAAKEGARQRYEALSSKHGMDLHKHLTEEEGDN